MVNSKFLQQTDFVLFAGEFAQPSVSLRAIVQSLWVELQNGWRARRAAIRQRKVVARGRSARRHNLGCGTLPQWQNR